MTALAIAGWITGTVPAAAVFLWWASRPARFAFRAGRAAERIRRRP